jgi:hypothetical protein
VTHLTYLRPPRPTQWGINNKLASRLIRFVLAVESDRVQDGFKILAYAAGPHDRLPPNTYQRRITERADLELGGDADSLAGR